MDSDPNSGLSRFKLDSKLERGKYARKREDHGIIYRHLTRDCTKHEHEFNLCMAAYKEVITLAKNEGVLAEADSILGDLNGLENPFRSLPPPGKKIEFSVAKSIVPGISPDKMQRIMMDENSQWFKSMFPIVTKRNSAVHCYFDHLRTRDPSIWHVLQVCAEMHLPSASAPTRYFEFLRYRKMIEPLLYIIVDFPSEEFACSWAMRNSKRNPSGVIIRFRADTGEPEGCEIIWIENVEVDETGENNMYSSIINSNLAFGAQRCINTLLHNLKRDKSKFADSIIPVAPTAGSFLLAYTETMKHFFVDCVCQYPYGQTLTVKSSAEDPIRILHNKTRTEDSTFIGVASFRVQAKPLAVFQFLMKKDIDLEARYYTPADSESETDEEAHERPEQIDEVHEEPKKIGEVHEKSEQTDGQVHEKLEKTDEEVHEKPEQIDEVPEHTDEVHEESEKTDGEVHEEPEQTDEEVHEKSEQTDGDVHKMSEQIDEEVKKTDEEVHELEQIYEVYEEPEQTDEVHKGSDQTNGEVHEEPEYIDEVDEGLEHTYEVYEESEHTNGEVHKMPKQIDEEIKKTDEEFHEGLEQIDEIHEESEQTDEVHEGHDQTNGEVHEESEQTDRKIHEVPEQIDEEVNDGFEKIHEVYEGLEQTDEIHEGLEQINGKVYKESEQTDEIHKGIEQTNGKVYKESERQTNGKVYKESEHTNGKVYKESEQTNGKVYKESEQTNGEVYKESEQTNGKVYKESEQTDEIHEGLEQTDRKIYEGSEQTDEVHEEPEHIDGEVHEKSEQADEEVHEKSEHMDEKIDENHEKPKLVVTFGTDDKSNIISLHRLKLNELANAYILQEASMNEHCSFIISKILTEQMVDRHIISGMKSKDDLQAIKEDSMTPIGFAIMPDGRGGLDCDACLVTFLTQLYYEPNSNDYNVELVRRDFVTELNDVIQGLNENVVVEEGKMTEYF